MKIPLSIRQLYDSQYDLNVRVKDFVDNRINALKQPRWHYESRIKELQSFALKLETGRFNNPLQMEDFFACTLVVSNTLEIDTAQKLIRKQFSLHERRPFTPYRTHKSADSFQFDDLRLYVSIQQDPALPPNDLTGTIFEVQIKTFLQHAWSIATHDLIYKSDDVSWSQARIAYQIKAMLEHAEVSIQEADRLAENATLKKEDRHTANIRRCIELLKLQWKLDDLPVDVQRLARNVILLLEALELKVDRLKEILALEKQSLNGNLPLNLSPYAIIVQSLLHYEKDKMQHLLINNQGKIRVVISSELEFPGDMDRASCCNAIFIGQPSP